MIPYRTAAECIDWSLPCPSIFLSKEEGQALGVRRPLAENTLRRIAHGTKRYVIDAEEPFIVPVTHQGDSRVHPISEPFRTVTCANRGEFALCTPYLVNTRNGERTGQAPRTRGVDEPFWTITGQGSQQALVAAHISRQFGSSVGSSLDSPTETTTAGGGKSALVAATIIKNMTNNAAKDARDPLSTILTGNHHYAVAAFLAQHNSGMVGHDARTPMSTIVGKGSNQGLVASHLVKLKGTSRDGQPVTEPLHTVQASGFHYGEVRAFLLKYFGTDQDPRLREPMHTLTTKHRFGLVTVAGQGYVIVDIGMRMLQPRELFRAQGFPEEYRIDGTRPDGKPITKTDQVRLCGNSVCPQIPEALVRANFEHEETYQRVAA